jgi:hypothetical protein
MAVGAEDDAYQNRGNTTTPLFDFGETGSLKSHEKECFLVHSR